jgi:hypothetical protein
LATIPARGALLRRRDSRKYQLRGQAVDVPRILDLLGHTMALGAFGGTARAAAREVRAMSTDAYVIWFGITLGVYWRRRIFAFTVA